MSATKQVAAVVGMNTRAMTSRFAASLVVVVGMAAVVAVALSVFSMSAGLTEMVHRTVPSPDRMAIVQLGAIDGGPSNIPKDALAILADTPGLKMGPDGKPLISGTVGANFVTRRRDKPIDAFVGVTGVAPNRIYGRPEIKIIEGRMFTAGLRELIAGKAAVARFEGVELGKEVMLANGPWKIVGIYEGAGTSDFNLWGDSDTVAAAFQRTTYGVIFATLQEGTKAAQEAFKTAVRSNPGVSVEAETEFENRMRGTRNSIDFYRFLAYGVGGIMGLGALFAALNTMYAAVSARTVEIATLRALGFGATPVVISIAVECLVLALLGAIIGIALAWSVFNGRAQNFGSIQISEIVTPAMVGTAILTALIVGAVGALFPAIRAARLPVATALQVR